MSHRSNLREHAISIWKAAVDAVRPVPLIQRALQDPELSLHQVCTDANRIIVIGGGKAGAAMAAAIEDGLPDLVGKMSGVINVPDSSVRQLRVIGLHGARPAGTNFPTADGVAGARQMLDMVKSAGPNDVVLCLLSGGGSALLPAPVESVTVEDKLEVTRQLHASGATINEMNAVRKHLSDIKGGRLAQAFRGRVLISLIISDVIGDPLDVIASGPTATDPTTFAAALAILDKYRLLDQVPSRVREHLENGRAGAIPETPKQLPQNVRNVVIGNNAMALNAAQERADALGYRMLNLGSGIEGETRQVAEAHVEHVRALRQENTSTVRPTCLLSGGETTVTLAPDHGKGGRNQEFVLATLIALGAHGMPNTVVLSGGTDGEDGPTDAAGAIADSNTLIKSRQLGLNPQEFLDRHDAYNFFKATGDLLVTGLTETNVMDVRVILIG